MSLKLEPVAWLTAAAVVVGGLLEADRQLHVLPTSWGHWPAFAALGLGLIVAGARTRSAVTPIAAPKDDAGTRLVPVTMKTEPPAPDLPGIPPSVWAPKHMSGD
jgi:hypothetical protein